MTCTVALKFVIQTAGWLQFWTMVLLGAVHRYMPPALLPMVAKLPLKSALM